jgi:ABC-type branched-subunit amino acid transport system substrate-binding protein
MRIRMLVATTAVLALVACSSDNKPAATTTGSNSGASSASSATASPVTVDAAGRLLPAKCEGTNQANASSGVTENTVNIATLSIDFKALAAIGFAATDRDPTQVFDVFSKAINAAGGVCGRTIDLQKVTYDVVQNKAGEACAKVTQDRANLVVNSASFDQPTCITDAGVPLVAATDVSTDDLSHTSGLLFSRGPSLDAQFKATVQYAQDQGYLKGKVGVWYGNIFPNVSGAVEATVLPMLDQAGVQYKAVRTDAAGPSDPQGNAVLTSAATEFASQKVDTVLMFVGPTNQTGMQAELHKQGLDPRYLSAPVAGNTSNEIFADRFGTRAFTTGQQWITYSVGISELDQTDALAAACNEQWTKLTGETVAPKTFDYSLVASVCVQVDEIVAALSIAGADLSRETLVTALEQLPSHRSPGLLGQISWTHDARTSEPVFSVQTYDGAANTVKTDPNSFKVSS